MASERYDHRVIEKKWQEHWEQERAHEAPDSKPGTDNFYLLTEFPYPSGNLHVGHWYAFSVPDIFARYMRMRGYNVLYPIGFDAFGLPAENAAIKRGINPRDWTFDNIDYMRGQLRSMGATFDWSREVITADPAYYKWTQWLFVQFFNKGLAYRKETAVNWCPNDKTVLANEQVVEGRCERCGHEVEQRLMPQWNLKITEYADRLVDDLANLDWPKQIKDAQVNWIGRSEGAEIDFYLDFGDSAANARTGPDGKKAHITVFTTRPDTLFGATYVVLAPEHPWVTLALEHKTVLSNTDEVLSYKQATEKKTERERLEDRKKTGVELKGVKAINPATGEEIPIFVADYVLATYGTGAIMAVPDMDERDGAFAKAMGLPISETKLVDARSIVAQLGGTWTKRYRLRDWVVSRQRYWGVPIPMVECPACGWQPVPESDLPVLLPDVKDYLPTGDGQSPLSKVADFVNAACPKCGGAARRETDTLDTFVDSSWYFLRYADPKNEGAFADPGKLSAWMPVNLYSGGSEHTTMHLLYSRFWHKAMYDLGLVREPEPYLKRLNRGLIMGPDGQKMSKSRGNVIDPDAVVRELGADVVRMYLAFIGPYNEVGSYPWNPQAAVGVRRFLERVWRLETSSEGATVPLDAAVKKISDDIESLKFNTAVSGLMVALKSLEEKAPVSRESYETFLRLLNPFAPHIAHELAQEHAVSLLAWPVADESRLTPLRVTVAVQVNGKARSTVELAPDAPEETALAQARAAAGKWLEGRQEKRAVYVPGKIVNFVV